MGELALASTGASSFLKCSSSEDTARKGRLGYGSEGEMNLHLEYSWIQSEPVGNSNSIGSSQGNTCSSDRVSPGGRV